ncbi:UNVERIFIED_CONTAM: hypothetical protein HDU68_009863 [Siphonaria sp. JEL0065]|nr:hypothetical protein HDU68_009863 [Siphonaria sp. JEL0065]
MSSSSSPVTTQVCRFFNTDKGCQNGDSCRFSHSVPAAKPKPQKLKQQTSDNNTKPKQKKPQQRGQKKKTPSTPDTPDSVLQPLQQPALQQSAPQSIVSRPVPPPNPNRAPMARPAPKVPENLSPLELELRSIERRYRSSYKVVSATPLLFTSSEASGPSNPSPPHQQHQQSTPSPSFPPTIIEFEMAPSDPDFPFDLEALQLRLIVPTHVFPSDASPHLASILSGTRIKVLNPDIPPELARSVEVGFRKKIDAHLINNATTARGLVAGQVLLSMTNWLDRELERLLSGLGDSDIVGVTGLVVNNSRTAEELRQGVIDRVNVGFNQVDLMVARTDRDGGRLFYYGVPVDENENKESDSDEDGDLTGSEFNETESVVTGNDVDDDADESATVENQDPASSSSSTLTPTHRGTQIRLVDPSLRGIAILECVTPKFLLSCTRCKSNFDSPQNLLPNTTNTRACPTCSTLVSITYRPAMVHMSSQTVGYLDLDGYAVLDMLPSAWKVTCEQCNKETSSIGVLKSLPRGEVEFRVGCTGCHGKMGIMS